MPSGPIESNRKTCQMYQAGNKIPKAYAEKVLMLVEWFL